MNRRLLVVLVAGGALAAPACGPTSVPSSAPETTAAPSAAPVGGTRPTDQKRPSDASGSLQEQADRLLETIFQAERELDYDTIATSTTGAVRARYRSQELLSTVEGLDPSFTTPAAKSVTVTNDVKVGASKDGTIPASGSVTASYVDAEGTEASYTYTDLVFAQEGDELLLADWRSDSEPLPASSAFLVTSDLEPATVGDFSITLEPGYRAPKADPPFVEYLFTITNESDGDVDLHSAELMTPDNETFEVQFGVAGTAAPGGTSVARVGFEGPSVPVSGGTLWVTLADERGDRFLALVDVPAFLDEDGKPERSRGIELDDVPFSKSGTLSGTGSGSGTPTTTASKSSSEPSSKPEVLQEISDAAAFRDSLLAIARTENDPTNPALAWGIPTAWVAAVPGLDIVGYQIEASPTAVSGFAIVGDKNGTAEGLPFAVMDSSGSCAGGVIMGLEGKPVAFRVVDLDGATTCNAAAVIEAVGLG